MCAETRSVNNLAIPLASPPASPHRLFTGPAGDPSPTVGPPPNSAWSLMEGIQPGYDPDGPDTGWEDRDFDGDLSSTPFVERYPTEAEVNVTLAYPFSEPGGPTLVRIERHPTSGAFRLHYASVPGGSAVLYRYWHVSGLSRAGQRPLFRPTAVGGSPRLRAVYTSFRSGLVPPTARSLLPIPFRVGYRVDEFYHRPVSELKSRIRLVLPATPTPQPVTVVRPARPFLTSLTQDFTSPGLAIAVSVPNSPAGLLEYRFWRHTGHRPPESLVPWVVAPGRNFVIQGLPRFIEYRPCYQYGVFNPRCPILVPVFWDVEVRVTSGGTSDPSQARSILLYSVEAP